MAGREEKVSVKKIMQKTLEIVCILKKNLKYQLYFMQAGRVHKFVSSEMSYRYTLHSLESSCMADGTKYILEYSK